MTNNSREKVKISLQRVLTNRSPTTHTSLRCASMGRRQNGCSRPFTGAQIWAWVGQTLLLTWFGVVAFGFLHGTTRAGVAAFWIILVLCSMTCWAWCQLLDPGEGVGGPQCFVFVQHESHYCAACKKSVPGIDHHCKWLGTCVGSKNYLAFYALTFLAGVLYLWQAIVMALVMSAWRDGYVEDLSYQVFGNIAGLYGVCTACLVVSLPVSAFYFVLFAFHTYLQYVKLTTYEFVIERNKAKRKKRKEQAEVAKAAKPITVV